MRFPEDVPTLTQGDVVLRAHRPSDIGGIVAQCNDPLSVEFTTVPLGYDAENGGDWVTKQIPTAWTSGKERLFAIESTHPDGQRRFSGSISLRDEGGRRAEIAFGAHPDIRGRGVMTTATNLLLDYGFAECGFENVIWMANIGNEVSRRVAWRTGFAFGGTLTAWLDHRGRLLDGWFAMLHRDDSREPKTRWLETPRLAGHDVLLREMASSDEQRFIETATDPESMHWLATSPIPRTPKAYRRALAERSVGPSTGSSVTWTIADPESDRYLGSLSMFGFRSLDYRSAEIGYRTHPDARRRGLLTQAIRLALGPAFTSEDEGGYGLHRLSLGAGEGNSGSQAVARACGFTETGRDRQCYDLNDGSVVDLIRFDLLKPEWDRATEDKGEA
ncbi:MAG: GNAT family N-acetyltransferase [Nocardioidaceae bacterium]|nr:GNAT family N-acetyltransferase [Nocardioidaceae bacterium]